MTRFKNLNGINVQLTEAEETQRDADEANALAEQQANAHKAPRRNEYGEIGDQLDEIFKDIDAWKVRIQTIKDKYPKE